MSIQFFAPRGFNNAITKLPSAYRRTVNWLPKIGDIVPNFTLQSTHGDIDFWSWAEGSWVFFFSHPAAKTPVCTTEIAALAANECEFQALGTKVLGLTGSSLAEQVQWHRDIEKTFDTSVWFPTMEDTGGRFAELFGMVHEKENEAWPIRKSFILDPQMKIRMIFEYPMFVGRSVDETLRVIEAVQLRLSTGLATPSDWFDGDPVIVPNTMSERELRLQGYGKSRHILPYLQVAVKD